MPLRILFISPKFYGVEHEIQSVLKKSGYEVEWIENKDLVFDYHGKRAKFKILREIYFFLFFPQIRYIRRELSRIDEKRFDILFSINGHVICPYLFKRLKLNNPGLKSVLYLWDASSMYSWEKEMKYFDKVFTFDPIDSEKFGIEYKPNFYIKASGDQLAGQKHDLFFAGKFSFHRLFALDRIVELTNKFSLEYYFKLWPAYKVLFHSKLIYNLLVKIKAAGNWVKNYKLNFEAIGGILKRDFIIDKWLGFREVQQHLLCSNIILDIPFHEQKGYSHRMIEALSNGKKVITSNLHVKNEKFFNPDQIHLIDPENPVIDFKWVKDSSTFPVSEYFLNLELSVWLKSVLNAEVSQQGS